MGFSDTCGSKYGTPTCDYAIREISESREIPDTKLGECSDQEKSDLGYPEVALAVRWIAPPGLEPGLF